MNQIDIILHDIDKRITALVESVLLTMPAALKECARENESFRAVFCAGIAVNISKSFLKAFIKLEDDKNE